MGDSGVGRAIRTWPPPLTLGRRAARIILLSFPSVNAPVGLTRPGEMSRVLDHQHTLD